MLEGSRASHLEVLIYVDVDTVVVILDPRMVFRAAVIIFSILASTQAFDSRR